MASNIFTVLAEEKKVGLLPRSSAQYTEDDYAALADLVDTYHAVYVTVSKPSTVIRQQLQENGVDTENVFFIDAVAGKEGVADNVIAVESPAHLTNLSIAITEFADAYRGEPKFLIFDALSTLPTYVNNKLFERFAHHVIGRIRGWNMGAAFLCAPDVLEEQVEATVHQLCDTVT